MRGGGGVESYRDGIYRIKFPAPEEMLAIQVKLFTALSGMFLGSFGQNMLPNIKIKLFYQDQEEEYSLHHLNLRT